MPPKKVNRSIGAEHGCAARRTQRGDENEAGARSYGGRARTQKSGLRVGMLGRKLQSHGGIEYGEMAEEEEGAGTASPVRGSQGAPKSMRVVGRGGRRRDGAACSELTKSNNMGIEALVDRQRETSEGIQNGGVAKAKGVVETATPRRGS